MINNTHMYLTSSGSYSLLSLAFFHKTCTPPPSLNVPTSSRFQCELSCVERYIWWGGGRKEDRQSTSQHWRVFSKRLIYAVQFATCIALTISLQHKLCRVNQTYEVRQLYVLFTRHNSCRRLTESTSHTTRLYGLNRAKDQYLRFIVTQDPRKDRILHQIIVWAARQSVEVHQVLEVRYFTSLMRQTINKQSLGQKQKRWHTKAELIQILLLQATIPLTRTTFYLVIYCSVKT